MAHHSYLRGSPDQHLLLLNRGNQGHSTDRIDVLLLLRQGLFAAVGQLTNAVVFSLGEKFTHALYGFRKDTALVPQKVQDCAKVRPATVDDYPAWKAYKVQLRGTATIAPVGHITLWILLNFHSPTEHGPEHAIVLCERRACRIEQGASHIQLHIIAGTYRGRLGGFWIFLAQPPLRWSRCVQLLVLQHLHIVAHPRNFIIVLFGCGYVPGIYSYRLGPVSGRSDKG